MSDAGEEHTASMVLNALMRMRMRMTSSSRTTHPSSRARAVRSCSSSKSSARKLNTFEERRKLLTNRVKTMANADAIEVRDVLNVVRGDEDEEDKDEDDEEEEGKREENWSRRKENMKEKMSALLKLLYSMQESRECGCWEKNV